MDKDLFDLLVESIKEAGAIRRGEATNDLTAEPFRKTDAGIDLIECDDTTDMFKKLGM